MQFAEVIRSRYAVRAYQARAVEDDVLQRVLEACVLAPTAANRQPFGLIVARTAGREAELRRVYKADWFAAQPPLVVVACATPERAWVRGDGKNYADVDVAIAVDHLTLAAADEGLGTCWIGAFDPQAAREVFGLPAGVEPVVMTPLGYAADTPRPKLRKKLEQLVHMEKW
ncbi:MAG: nitroreductase family protein [Chloroflexota bacterium]